LFKARAVSYLYTPFGRIAPSPQPPNGGGCHAKPL
jgi:hypothetical protein